jgi:hypothetical protein
MIIPPTLFFYFVSVHILNMFIFPKMPGSSVSIVSYYGLDDLAIEVRSPAETIGLFLYITFPDRLWGPPSPLYNEYWGPFPGLKRDRGVTLTTHPHLVLKSRMSGSYTWYPPKRLRGVQWNSFYISKTILLQLSTLICMKYF